MSKTNHTPGPWHVQPDPEFIGGHPVHQNRFITCGNPDITDESWANDPHSYIIASMRDCQNQVANARLIAAAPELLAACKSALAALTQNKTYPADIKLAVGNLSLAIDKATMEPA